MQYSFILSDYHSRHNNQHQISSSTKEDQITSKIRKKNVITYSRNKKKILIIPKKFPVNIFCFNERCYHNFLVEVNKKLWTINFSTKISVSWLIDRTLYFSIIQSNVCWLTFLVSTYIHVKVTVGITNCAKLNLCPYFINNIRGLSTIVNSNGCMDKTA